MVKKIVIGFGVLIILLFSALFLIPILFKDKIKTAIDKELARTVNADVVFDAENFSLSVFRNFPNITASLHDFGIFNRAPFAGEVLFAARTFEVEVNLKDILFGDQFSINGVTVISPILNILVLEDGRANYDITFPEDEAMATDEPAPFSFRIKEWRVVDADIVYEDRSIPFYLDMRSVQHTGSGDFSEVVFDLKTKMEADSVTVRYDGFEYITNKRAAIDAIIGISEDYTRYTFKDNTTFINDFALTFDGWLKMNENDYAMDITYGSPENTFKSLLSIVPGMYTESFANLQTEGELKLAGFVKGTYSDTQMPAFQLSLNVIDAMFRYPDLPTPVTNINLDMLVDNQDGIIDNTTIDIRKFHMDFGSNPFDARALISKMYPTQVDANIVAKLNLAEINKMFPVQGLDMRGTYTINVSTKGVYDSLKKTIPSIDAVMSLANGYIKSSDFPLPLEDLKFIASVKNNSGKMAETFIGVKDFSMMMDGERFTADLVLQNIEDYTWDLKVNGGIDLEKITKIFPLEGMTVAGKVKADIQTKGKMSDLEAERYDRLPTSGSASLTNFQYTAADMPYAVALSQAEMSFDPRKIELRQMSGTVGKSDFSVNGFVLNYIDYLFGKNQLLKGTLNYNASLLDLNEFMTDSGEETTTEESYGVIPVPQNLDFVLKSNVATVKMMDFNITNATGEIIIREGVANLRGLTFNLLGGGFLVTGAYDTRDMQHPKYDFGLKIDNLALSQAAAAFTIVKTFAPVAGLMSGNFSTDFKLSGELLQDLMPDLKTLNGEGLVRIAQASLKESLILSGISSLTKLDNTNEVTLRDVLMSAHIKDGRLNVRPFNVKFGQYTTAVSGSTGIDGSINYNLKMDVPAGQLGTQFNSFVSQYTGGKTDPNAMIPVNIDLGGTFLSPRPVLNMTEQKQQVQQAVTEAAKQEAEKKATELVTGLLGGSKADTTKKDSTATTPADPKQKAVEEGVKTIQNLLKKKKIN
jgi:hypothetical protein